MTSTNRLFNFFAICLLLVSTSAFAASDSSAPTECESEAVTAAVKTNFSRFSVPSNSCGVKLLMSGDYRETYLVCVVDATNPSEWIVVIEKTPLQNGEPTGEKCRVEFADVQYDSKAPNFGL